MKLTTHLHVVPKLRMSGTVLPHPAYALVVCVGTTFPYLKFKNKNDDHGGGDGGDNGVGLIYTCLSSRL
jgi:hypothetical protein